MSCVFKLGYSSIVHREFKLIFPLREKNLTGKFDTHKTREVDIRSLAHRRYKNSRETSRSRPDSWNSAQLSKLLQHGQDEARVRGLHPRGVGGPPLTGSPGALRVPGGLLRPR